MKLTFLGTRGEIEIRSRRHRRHSSLLVQYNDARVMIDCGTDWLGRLRMIAPTAVVLTHAHPDHASGLAEGAPCPVYATSKTLALLRRYPISDRRTMPLRKSVAIDRPQVQGVSGPTFDPSARCWISRIGGKPQLLLRAGRGRTARCFDGTSRNRPLHRRRGDRETFDGPQEEWHLDRARSNYLSARLVPRSKGSLVRSSLTVARQSCAVIHVKSKEPYGGSVSSGELMCASPMTGSGCRLAPKLAPCMSRTPARATADR